MQRERFESRRTDPLKQWKISPVDEKAQENWDVYTRYKEKMYSRTHTTYSPWIIVQSNDKKKARLESMRYVLSTLDYKGKHDPGPASCLIRTSSCAITGHTPRLIEFGGI